jgi:hypothetical protein
MVYSTPVAMPPPPPQPECYIRKRTHSFSVQPYATLPPRRSSLSNGPATPGGISRRQAIYGPNALAAVSFPTTPTTPAATVITIPPSPALSAARHAPAQSGDIEERPAKKQKRKEKGALAKLPSHASSPPPPPISAPTSKPTSRFNLFHSRSLSVGEPIAAASPKIKSPTPKRLSLPGFGKSRTDGARTPSPAPLSAVFSFPSIAPPRSPSPTKMQISTPRAPSPTKIKSTPIAISPATTTNLAASMPPLKRTPPKSIDSRLTPLRRSPPRAKSASPVSEDLDMVIIEEEEEEEAASPLSPPGLSTPASTDVMELDKHTPAMRRGVFLSQPRRLPKYERASTPEPPAVRTPACPSPNNPTPRFNRIPTPPPPPPRFSSPLGPVRKILPPRPQFPRPPKSEHLVIHRCGEKPRPLIVQSLGQKGQAAEMYRRVVTRNAKVVWREACELRRRERKERPLGGEDEGYTLKVAGVAASVKEDKDGQRKPKERTLADNRMDVDERSEVPSDLESLPDIPDMEFDLEDEESDRTPLPKTPSDADMRFNLTPPPPPYVRLPSENLQHFYQTLHRQAFDTHSQHHLQLPLQPHNLNYNHTLATAKSFSQQADPFERKRSIARDALLELAKRPVDLRGSTTSPSAEAGVVPFASPRSIITKLPFKAPAVISSSRSPTLSA